MLRNGCRLALRLNARLVHVVSVIPTGSRQFSSTIKRSSDNLKGKEQNKAFDTSVLEYLVCPLSKKPLRYEESTDELINEELGIAYPVIDGIPNMIPQDARVVNRNEDKEETLEK
ncbi:protein preY, mitochondrial [Latimeria chalumnae]|uniref:Protein preY, mitochondrial n=1 Tax=Latimeria chalumnae TaxID=7897 RepID=H3AP40_LATCH|nr:PREDICTED: protein preY, mitochondrial [Latimeria chalumnae]|eukprot:XP_006001034.1 PREDICTED: protein preY, mitochondrial [Latimeria chalumnae]